MSDPSFAGVYLTNSDSGHMDEQVDTNMIKETLHEPNKFHTPNSNNTTSFTNKLITKNNMESDAISEETDNTSVNEIDFNHHNKLDIDMPLPLFNDDINDFQNMFEEDEILEDNELANTTNENENKYSNEGLSPISE